MWLFATAAGCDGGGDPPHEHVDPDGGIDPGPGPLGVACPEQRVPGQICTLAGSGTNGWAGDDGPAIDARFSLPLDVTPDPDGGLFVVDWNNHRIRRIDPDGTVRHVLGLGQFSGELDDFVHPTAAVVGPDGRLYVAAWHSGRVTAHDLDAGLHTRIAGDGRRGYDGDGGIATEATLDLAVHLVFDAGGQLLIMDQANQMIRGVGTDGIIRHVAGRCVAFSTDGCDGALVDCPGGPGKQACSIEDCAHPCNPTFAGDGGPAVDLRMAQPFGASADPGGRMLFDAAGNLVFADPGNDRIRRIDPDGVASTIAGGDGEFDHPSDVALDADGTLYVADTYEHCVRAIDLAGEVTTVAGRCVEGRGYAGDGGPATEALLKLPFGVEVVGDALIIADTGNMVIREVTLR